LARVLLASAEATFDCVDEIVDVVAALSVENIFLNIHHSQQHQQQQHRLPSSSSATTTMATGPITSAEGNGIEGEPESESRASHAETLRRALFRRQGDHLTLLATIQAYADENTDRRRWCDERMLSHRALSAAMDVRKQLTSVMAPRRRRLKQQQHHLHHHQHPQQQGKRGGNPNTTTVSSASAQSHDPSTLTPRILKCLLTGFHGNVARLSSDGSYRTLLTNQVVAVHPSSVLFGPGSPSSSSSSSDGTGTRGGAPQRNKFEGIMYNEFVYTGTKAYARGVSAVEMRWVEDILRR